MNPKNMNDEDVFLGAVKSAAALRVETTKLLHFLCEVERRRLFAKHGCDSLFEFCIKHLKMSQGQAARRVNAARVLREFPQIEDKMNSGDLTLTSVSQAQTHFNREAHLQTPISKIQKAQIIEQLDNQSTRSVEKILVSHTSHPEVTKENVRAVSENRTELKFSVDEETLADIEFLKNHWSHQMPGANYSALFKKMAKVCREKEDPLRKKPRSTATPAPELARKSTTQKTKHSRYIQAHVKRAVRSRDSNCTFIDKESGKRCCSRHRLQFDHVISFALGGENTIENLRLRCQAHNQWHAIETYGPGVLRYASH